MIKITQLKLPVEHDREMLEHKISKILRLKPVQIKSYQIIKRSLDARKKPLMYSYQIEVSVDQEESVVKKLHQKDVILSESKSYRFPEGGKEPMIHRPVVIGAGPAGLFCTYLLAKHGFHPILLERGEAVEQRQKQVELFWKTGRLNTASNVQFGEGGAGTFSDGKLNTLVKDPAGRNRYVLETFVSFGADEDILYESKPHIGTDVLVEVVKNFRCEIQKLGGEIRFSSQVTDFEIENGRLRSVEINHCEKIKTEVAVLAVGHSARDTFRTLNEHHVPMSAKPFAVGVRIEHPQEMINRNQYGQDYPDCLPAAAYKLTRQVGEDRGVYSFCMCPGGYVVNASSEEGMTAVNGMSYRDRAGENANSAMIITVRPEDFPSKGPLCGIDFQQMLEKAAYQAGNGKIPVQLFGDFCSRRISTGLGGIRPNTKGEWVFADVRGIFPENLAAGLEAGIKGCEKLIPGFSREDAVILGVESRTSSPVRIERNEKLESEIRGIYPCGEGAGYAGGIMSAAMDGIKVAEAIALKFKAC
ncbi:MAG: NAD(P)/FAD-dependent oxidoreductase [Lachnospiraceae bacterium]